MNLFIGILFIISLAGVIIFGIIKEQKGIAFSCFLSLVFCLTIGYIMWGRIKQSPPIVTVVSTSLINGNVTKELVEVTRVAYEFPWWFITIENSNPKYYVHVGGVSIEVGIEKRRAQNN